MQNYAFIIHRFLYYLFMEQLTITGLILSSIPVLLAIIGYIVKRGLTRFDTKMDESINVSNMLKNSINNLSLEVSKISIIGDQRQLRSDDQMSRVFSELTCHENTIDNHANKLQEHELKIAKLQKNEK